MAAPRPMAEPANTAPSTRCRTPVGSQSCASAGSKGAADFCALHPFRGLAWVQVGTAKSKTLGPAARDRLVSIAEQTGALPLLVTSGPGCRRRGGWSRGRRLASGGGGSGLNPYLPRRAPIPGLTAWNAANKRARAAYRAAHCPCCGLFIGDDLRLIGCADYSEATKRERDRDKSRRYYARKTA